jgi:diguanylate cyclase
LPRIWPFLFPIVRKKGHVPAIIAGIIMGIGISAMHYIGMAAMEMEVEYIYKPLILMASVLIAVVVSYVALFSSLQKFMGRQWIKVLTSVLMGLAITSMHYTGMAAVVFYTVNPVSGMHGMHTMDMPLLVMGVTVFSSCWRSPALQDFLTAMWTTVFIITTPLHCSRISVSSNRI